MIIITISIPMISIIASKPDAAVTADVVMLALPLVGESHRHSATSRKWFHGNLAAGPRLLQHNSQ